METYRIFVSSPGDVRFERQRVDRVVARLNGELAGAARLVSVRWETEFYRAHDTFQTQIPPSTDCDIVVAIFRARLGTELPPNFMPMPDGSPYPSGTAYEVLTAIAKRQKGGELPDVFVFRHPEPPLVRLDDEQKADETRRQWERLKSFFARWFQTSDGHFKAAFQTFTSTDDFESQLDRLLRDWLQQKLASGGVVTWPIETNGSPYPGLQSFSPKFAPVFFGRVRDTARAVEAWSEAKSPFLIVVGASGSGKSSLARAGLVPRLTTPGVIPKVDLWRVAALRPSDSPRGPVDALAHALMQAAADLPKDEQGRLPALPEIAAGDYGTPAELAALLARADASAIKPIVGALDRVAQQEQQEQAIGRVLRCDLVILVDQLDELFASSVSVDERKSFAAILERLLASDRVWVVTTLRADLYEVFLQEEGLFRLKESGVAYDLAPPALSEMAEVVRGPARAARLTWEIDPATGEPLDAQLIGDIDRPDLLPIVQFVLDRLYQERSRRGGDIVLTHAAYRALGTLNGAIETAAEAALAPLGEAGAAALPRLLRSLVTYAAPSAAAGRMTPALKQAPLAQAAYDEPSKALVMALIDARILVSGRDQSGRPVVGLAHQRVIEAWQRARNLIAENVELLRVREGVEEARRRWEAAGYRKDLLIPSGLPLSEAENAAGAMRDELSDATHAFIDKSGRSAKLHQRLTAAAALVFLGLAVAAGFLGFVANGQKVKAQLAAEEAQQQRQQAEAARAQADHQRSEADAARGVAEQQRQQAENARRQADSQRQQAEAARRLADDQRRRAEMRLAGADELLDGNGKTEELRQCAASTVRSASLPAPVASREFFAGRWHVDQGQQTSDMDWRADGSCVSKNVFERGIHSLDLTADVCTWTFEKRSDNEFVISFKSDRLPDNFPRRMQFKILNPTRIRNVDAGYEAFRIVCPAQEIELYQPVLAERQKLADSEPGNSKYQRDLANTLEEIASVLALQGQYRAALDEHAKGLKIRKTLSLGDPGNTDLQRVLSFGLERMGLLHQTLNEGREALEAFQSSLAIRRQLHRANPGDYATQHDLANALEQVGGALKSLNERARSLSYLNESLALRQRLADADRGNATLQIELFNILYWISAVSDTAKAKDALGKALAVLEALEREHKLTDDQVGWPKFIRGEIAKLP